MIVFSRSLSNKNGPLAILPMDRKRSAHDTAPLNAQ